MNNWSFRRIDSFAQVKSGKRLPLGKELVSYPTSYPYIRLVDIVNQRINAANIKYLTQEI